MTDAPKKTKIVDIFNSFWQYCLDYKLLFNTFAQSKSFYLLPLNHLNTFISNKNNL